MSDPNRPPFFSYGSFPSSEYQENDPAFNDWSSHPFPQPPFGAQLNYETPPGYGDNPAGSHVGTGERSLNSKVAIPRSANPSSWTSSGRVSRACENCREQKAKCSGHRPTCQRCQESGIRCSYGDRKREKMAKLEPQSAQHVEQVMNELNPDNDHFTGQEASTPSSTIRLSDTARVSSPAASSPGISLGVLDHTSEDFNRDEKIQAMGFVGEHSEIAWMYRLKRLLEQTSPITQQENPDRHSVASANFFLDDSDIPVLDDVDVSQRPSQTVADRLVDDYFQVVHPSFPIVGKVYFLRQYRSFYSAAYVRPGKKWLAILNLVFAIGARYSRFMQSGNDTPSDDGTVYFSRAWQLSMSDAALLDHPNLQQVQVEGLTSFYLLSVGQVNRSWRICGISLRSAVTMGLNLRSEGNAIAHVSKETRYRVWWSLYMLDVSLCVMTGRPPSSTDEFRTTPLPVPFKEEDFSDDRVVQLIADQEARNVFMEALSAMGSAQSRTEAISVSTPETAEQPLFSSNRECDQVASSAIDFLTPNISLYFLYQVELGLIVRETIDTLYAPGAARKSWREIEMAISALNVKADTWLSKLPPAFHFRHGTRVFEQQRSTLAFRFYSTKIIIAQPCLSHLTRQAPGTEPPGTSCEVMAAECVDFACHMLDLLPAAPDASWVYRVSPWWNVLHYLMQSMAVLLTQLLLRADVGSAKYNTVLEKIYKATHWLSEMSVNDPSSQRAWLVCHHFISHYAPAVDIGAAPVRHKN
ncbi:putative C6 transcription factor [Aspergillus clavatus NRRL 1]|uniref:C6 transcription factor, putative n=1 Tax=Aspergillus clavatus (strain ATCC 1007 / CBS 513.65 / DSM 816 / NCTC 3887 / NRRL 1 / QM 1276 / 107) TaxID=344612 RepID=A1CEE1_ASPCL|nr:C6 transcription factor, putative [Aspergillus clavatus NRRL 1]EAW11240.1 C6 transcription factor, putative [Aspergillus clavatus NRRL 1]